jgi:hypothetical protein
MPAPTEPRGESRDAVEADRWRTALARRLADLSLKELRAIHQVLAPSAHTPPQSDSANAPNGQVWSPHAPATDVRPCDRQPEMVGLSSAHGQASAPRAVHRTWSIPLRLGLSKQTEFLIAGAVTTPNRNCPCARMLGQFGCANCKTRFRETTAGDSARNPQRLPNCPNSNQDDVRSNAVCSGFHRHGH